MRPASHPGRWERRTCASAPFSAAPTLNRRYWRSSRGSPSERLLPRMSSALRAGFALRMAVERAEVEGRGEAPSACQDGRLPSRYRRRACPGQDVAGARPEAPGRAQRPSPRRRAIARQDGHRSPGSKVAGLQGACFRSKAQAGDGGGPVRGPGRRSPRPCPAGGEPGAERRGACAPHGKKEGPCHGGASPVLKPEDAWRGGLLHLHTDFGILKEERSASVRDGKGGRNVG